MNHFNKSCENTVSNSKDCNYSTGSNRNLAAFISRAGVHNTNDSEGHLKFSYSLINFVATKWLPVDEASHKMANYDSVQFIDHCQLFTTTKIRNHRTQQKMKDTT